MRRRAAATGSTGQPGTCSAPSPTHPPTGHSFRLRSRSQSAQLSFYALLSYQTLYVYRFFSSLRHGPSPAAAAASVAPRPSREGWRPAAGGGHRAAGRGGAGAGKGHAGLAREWRARVHGVTVNSLLLTYSSFALLLGYTRNKF